jgi:hypothetical protein
MHEVGSFERRVNKLPSFPFSIWYEYLPVLVTVCRSWLKLVNKSNLPNCWLGEVVTLSDHVQHRLGIYGHGNGRYGSFGAEVLIILIRLDEIAFIITRC